jgi:hypothetical protein
VHLTNRRVTCEDDVIQCAKRIEVEAVVTCFKTVTRYSSGGTERNCKIFHVVHVMTEDQNEHILNEKQKAIYSVICGESVKE